MVGQGGEVKQILRQRLLIVWCCTAALASAPDAAAETYFESVQGWLTCTTFATPGERAALGAVWLPATDHAGQQRYFSAARAGTHDFHFRYLTLLQAVASLADEVDDQNVRRDVLGRIIHYTSQGDPDSSNDLLFRQIHRCAWLQAVESLIGSDQEALLRSTLQRLVATYGSMRHEQAVEDWPLLLALRDVRADARVNNELLALVTAALQRANHYRDQRDADRAQRMWIASARGLLELGDRDRAYQLALAAAQPDPQTTPSHAQRWRAYPVLFDYFTALGKPEDASALEALFAGNLQPPHPADSVANFEVLHRLSRGAHSVVARFISDARFRQGISTAELNRQIANGSRFEGAAATEIGDYRISLTSLRRALREQQGHEYAPDHLADLTRNDPGYASRMAREYLALADSSVKRHLTTPVLVNKRARLIMRSRYSSTIRTLARLLPYVRQERGEIIEKTLQLAQLASHNGAAAVATSGLMGLNREGTTANSLTWNMRVIENPASFLEPQLRVLDAGNRHLSPVQARFTLDASFTAIALTRSDVFENREQFAAQLYRQYPQLGTFVLGAPVQLAGFRKFMGPKDAIVATHLGNDALFVWVVTASGAQLVMRAGPTGAVQQLVTRVRDSVEQAVKSPLRERIPYDAEAAWRLFEMTFGPVMADLKGSTRVYWYGDKALALIPPAIMLTRAPARPQLETAQDFKSAAFLANEFPLISMPELSIYQLALNPSRKAGAATLAATPKFLGIGGTQLSKVEVSGNTFARSIELAGGADQQVALSDLPKLAETVATLRAIERSMGPGSSTLWLGPDATKKRLIEADLTGYRVLVLATHGFLAGEMSRCGIGPYASLLLSEPAIATGECRDSLLTTPEISRLKLDADLVVLSACNTARSGSRGGLEEEPYFGLAAAFSAAGARNLAVSHWPVLVGAASELTAGVIRYTTTDGRAVDASLQKSIQGLRANAHTALEAHPAYWGPFVLIGSGRSTLQSQ